MEENTSFDSTRFNERMHRIISAFLVCMMMACVGLTVAQVGGYIIPEWKGYGLVLIGFLITLERFLSYRSLKKLSSFSRERIVVTSTQWVVNLIIIKLIVSLSHGVAVLLAEVPLWQRDFTLSFFSREYMIALMFAFLVWIFGDPLVEIMEELVLDAVMVERQSLGSSTREHTSPQQRLMPVVFGIGAVLMFLTAISRVDLRALFTTAPENISRTLSPLEAGGAGTLLYFLFGLALLSQANFISLNTHWFLHKVPVSREIASHWATYSIGFLVLMVLIVSFLPTSYSLGLLSVLGYLLNILLSIIMVIGGLIFTILSFLISLPFLLFSREVPEVFLRLPATQSVDSPTLWDPGSPIPWLELLKSFIFWAIFLGVVGYSIAQYTRQHEEILAILRKIPGWQLLAGFWRWLTRVFGGLNRGLTNVIRSGREKFRSQRESANLKGFSRFLRLGALSPRQKVFFYYQALLRRGNETGLPRDKSQTPDEYAKFLERSLPTVKEDVLSLTESFSEARYARHPVEPQDANQVKAYWKRIRQVFRGQRG